MSLAVWSIFVGFILITVALTSATLKRLPLTTPIIYLVIGLVLGSSGLNFIRLNIFNDTQLIRIASEIVVVISLFSAGLKLRLPLNSREWKIPLLLSSLTMLVTVLIFSLFITYFLTIPWSAAILLGAILAPTDPVLAAGVQVTGPKDVDKLRFSLTAEASLNDGTAFPFVILGLGLLAAPRKVQILFHWLAVDVAWAIGGGLIIGTLVAMSIGKIVGYFRDKFHEEESLDDFLALGVVGISYGISIVAHTYGFLAVFAAGLALRRGERRERDHLNRGKKTFAASITAETVTGQFTQAIVKFNEHLERIGEMLIVLVIGGLFSFSSMEWTDLGIALLLILVIRPIAVFLTIQKSKCSHRVLLSWFGIRGVGSLYYLMFAIESGLSNPLAKRFTSITLLTIAISILIHGITAAPLMLRRPE